MQYVTHRRWVSLITAVALVVLSAGASAIALIDFIRFDDLVIDLAENPFQLRFGELSNTGFSIRSRDGSALSLTASSEYDPASGLRIQPRVQEGFILLDGTLSLQVNAGDETRARLLTTYRLDVDRFDVRRGRFDRNYLVDALVRQRVVENEGRARTRARFMRLEDARVMRLVEREGRSRWIRAVDAIRETRGRKLFRSRTRPDGVLGHFGFARSDSGDPYVWAVMDRNSLYAVGVTVDRDSDDVPNSGDNCVGTPNTSQSNADGDGAGDACDTDDDNDSVLDAADNCPLQNNSDQLDHDLDGAGNACDLDDDNDAVLDGVDGCPTSAANSVVAANGCSIADTCPCENSWRNHGAYVKCVAQTSNSFLSAGLITSAQKDAIVTAGAQSVCGF
jgi:thrombospondin type 3 repeat protein